MAALLAMATGCGEIKRLDSTAGEDVDEQLIGSPPSVVATTGMIYDLLLNILPESYTVTGMIPSGVDPHLFRPTRQHLIALDGADVVIYNGLHLEGRMGDIFQRLRSNRKVLALAEKVAVGEYLLQEQDGNESDPHIWMDVGGWMRAVEAVADFFARHFPDDAPVILQRTNLYLAELQLLDNYVAAITATIPQQNRLLVTAHDAFGYFGRAYGLEVMGVQGISTESEAGLHDVEKLVQTIVARAVPAVFFETSVSDRNIRAIVEGAAARGHTVRVGGELFSDSMGPEGSYMGTYIGMIDHNATTITRALGGQAPAGGLREFLQQP